MKMLMSFSLYLGISYDNISWGVYMLFTNWDDEEDAEISIAQDEDDEEEIAKTYYASKKGCILTVLIILSFFSLLMCAVVVIL